MMFRIKIVAEPVERYSHTEKIQSSKMAFDNAHKFIYKDDEAKLYETFIAMFLDNSNRIIAIHKINIGNVRSTIVDVPKICLIASQLNASGVIVSHNHPSGKLISSYEDNKVTRKIQSALKLFDIRLLDHIIVTYDKGYYSYSDNDEI